MPIGTAKKNEATRSRTQEGFLGKSLKWQCGQSMDDALTGQIWAFVLTVGTIGIVCRSMLASEAFVLSIFLSLVIPPKKVSDFSVSQAV
jgi:hypothetical protein